MRVRGRVERLRQVVGGIPPTGQLDLIVAVPVGCGMADDQPPGVYVNADGRVATVVFEGPGPDEAVMAGLEARQVEWWTVTHAGPGLTSILPACE